MKTSTKLLLATALMVASHNVPAQHYGDYGGYQDYYGGSGSYDVYDSPMPQNSYVTPLVGGGGYRETYPGRGSITVLEDGFGGYNIRRNGFIPRSRW